MKIEQIREIANAVLYEGYLLYPYRHSAIKNRQRWTYGVIYPREYSEANGVIEPWTMRTETLITGQHTSLDIHVRFLHLLVRTVVPATQGAEEKLVQAASTDTPPLLMASHLANEPWEEAIEREVTALDLSLDDLVANPRLVAIEFPSTRLVEQEDNKRNPDKSPATIIREQQSIAGTVIIAAELVGTNLYKLSVQIENHTPGTAEATNQHNIVLRHSFVSTHTVLQVRQGTFISLLEPPEALNTIVQSCQNSHTWPVLVGNEGEYDTMLSSPIILYDYPQIAPESPGALFDGTEIDEILMLRILTLSDAEKQEIRQGDERAREILDRTESLSPEQFMKLHGTIRNLRPVGQLMEREEHG